ncbi:MAG: NAD-dependent epimerase/dehydratase family protein [Treponema sp.]|nr:NAD-dependent epimerase/dehydratase family protein [Treponema sp.]
MKRVLVIGENSYIGRSFEVFVKDKYEITMVSSRNNVWQGINFAKYDSVLHCAGIAHISHNPKMESLYYEVNCDLAVNVANKAKSEGIRQFIFLSSILVYGTNQSEVNHTTLPKPDNFYGNSKLKAEQELDKLASKNFNLCIVRSPMVYGRGCKGNFPKLVRLAKITPIFPAYPSKRSMIYIDNLCEFLCGMVDDEATGVFLPQNKEYLNAAEFVKFIADYDRRYIVTTRLFNPLIRLLMKRIAVFQKLFGGLYYTKQGNEDDYNIVEFDKSIYQSIENRTLSADLVLEYE